MPDPQLLTRIRDHLEKRTLDDLFCETLNWDPLPGPALELQVGVPVSTSLKLCPVAHLKGLPVYRVAWPESQLPNVTQRRAVHKALAPRHVEHLLCYETSDRRALAFVWAHKLDDKRTELRTLPYELGQPARTTIERIAELRFALGELRTILEPQVADRLGKAFNVQTVTTEFFVGYKQVFADLQARLLKPAEDKVWAHDYALQLLNRLMFLYFIQRKRWLGGDPGFMRTLWDAYRRSGLPKDSFFANWLSVLFFEAFSQKFQAGRHDRRHLPPEIREALATAPYLNGGLFARGKLDDEHDPIIPDAFFSTLFDSFDGSTPGFLERHNFTIAESTPLDVEVAVDPEMIGKVYENLVNVTFEGLTEEDQRGKGGIFYTPRVEIDLMCRLSLVNWLANHLGEKYRLLLYRAVFAGDQQGKDEADAELAALNLWPELNRLLRAVTICDPACGSGSFLVGMLLVLDDLLARANAQLGIEESAYQRRRRIIGSSLYGVDVMDWAVHVTELRLWLQLVVETELKPGELVLVPLLPNLSFKVRQGDSLVQEVGGINFGLHRSHMELPPAIKGKITQLQGKKLRFFQGDTQGQSEELLKEEEKRLFQDALTHRQHALVEEVKSLTRSIASPPEQMTLVGISQAEPKRLDLLVAGWTREKEEKQAELGRVEKALAAIKTAKDIPFVWDIAFVEVFEGEKRGYDIVVGNPPYVCQMDIAPPNASESDYPAAKWRELKTSYKTKLRESVVAAYPDFFRGRQPDARSDLYIYFYFHGLTLLNQTGCFSFITSNSWLDVGYGKDLQEFLLHQSHVKLVLDNEAKRTFAQADVSTVIVLLTAPSDRRDDGLAKTARFVVLKKPFEQVVSAGAFASIEDQTERYADTNVRVAPVLQRTLLEDGFEAAGEDESVSPSAESRRLSASGPLIRVARYIGDKWGGKYLRAPDVFWTIMEKGKSKLTSLGGVADVRFGIKTGADDWFYLTRSQVSQLGIERQFLRPVLTNPGDRNLPGILVTDAQADKLMVFVHANKRDLRSRGLLKWIQNGETVSYKGRGATSSIPAQRPSVRGRKRWYELPRREPAPILWVEVKKRRSFTLLNQASLLADRSFYDVIPHRGDPETICALMNCTVTAMFCEIQGNAPGGSGAGVQMTCAEVRRLPILRHDELTERQRADLLSAFRTMCKRAMLPMPLEVGMDDRRALDMVVAEVLKLDAAVLSDLYGAVAGMVEARLKKAGSV